MKYKDNVGNACIILFFVAAVICVLLFQIYGYEIMTWMYNLHSSLK